MASMIVVLHPSDELYGADRVLLSLVERLQTRDHVEVWLPTDVDYPEKALSSQLAQMGVPARNVDLPVLRRAYANPQGMSDVARRTGSLATLLREQRPDAIYINTSALAPAVPVAALLGIPNTLHIHETWGDFERRSLTRLCTPADLVVTVGKATRDSLPETLRRRAVIRRHSVLAGAAEPDMISRIRTTASTGPEDVIVLFAGRWTPGKGLDELLQAVAAVDDPRLRLLLLGGPPPSGASVDATELVTRLGLTDRVTITGEVEDVWPYIYASDAVAVPSVKPESYPTIALEAIAANRRVLASDIGGLPEIVGPDTGILIAPGDVPAWTRALRSLLAAPHLPQ